MAEKGITQIVLGLLKVGILRLPEAIAQVSAMQLDTEAEIARELLARLRLDNYIPAGAEVEYQQAFLRAYKKARGERVEEPQGAACIRLLGTGCPACQALKELVMSVVLEVGLLADVEQITDIKEIATLGILHLPAILIDDEVKCTGSLPKHETLKQWLLERKAQVNFKLPPGA